MSTELWLVLLLAYPERTMRNISWTRESGAAEHRGHDKESYETASWTSLQSDMIYSTREMMKMFMIR
jgi:hypothetical protein